MWEGPERPESEPGGGGSSSPLLDAKIIGASRPNYHRPRSGRSTSWFLHEFLHPPI